MPLSHPLQPEDFGDSLKGYSLQTERLYLRIRRPSDAPQLKDAIDRNLAHLRAWMPWAMHEPSELGVLEARLVRFHEQFLAGEDRQYGIFDLLDNSVVGSAGLHRCGFDSFEIGYWLCADKTGNGFATEAVLALTRFTFTLLGAKRVEIRCDPRNVKSANVPRRLGYKWEQTLIAESVKPDGSPRDTDVWALEADQYHAGT